MNPGDLSGPSGPARRDPCPGTETPVPGRAMRCQDITACPASCLSWRPARHKKSAAGGPRDATLPAESRPLAACRPRKARTGPGIGCDRRQRIRPSSLPLMVVRSALAALAGLVASLLLAGVASAQVGRVGWMEVSSPLENGIVLIKDDGIRVSVRISSGRPELSHENGRPGWRSTSAAAPGTRR